MSDDKTKKDFRDSSKINTKEKYEVQYWTKTLKISPQQLVGAIKAAKSSSVVKVKEYLKGKK